MAICLGGWAGGGCKTGIGLEYVTTGGGLMLGRLRDFWKQLVDGGGRAEIA